MCGIAGWIARRGEGFPAHALDLMLAFVRHRGPDDAGELAAGSADGFAEVALGHRRLSVIDLEGGHQPMVLPDGTAVTFNGEIYNHRELRAELQQAGAAFTTSSDTEVLLHSYRAWGAEGLLARLNGMFAFALWDPAAGRLLLARDPFGQKPLFFLHRGGTLAFASEIKALLTLPGVEPRIDRRALAHYFDWLFVPAPRTLFARIKKLPPGTAAVWERGSLHHWAFHTPPDALPRQPLPDGDPPALLRAALEAAVARHMVADVPVGAFLSGGLDSSSVVALMARHSGRPVETFSAGFAEPAYSELPYARSVARHLGCRHHDLVFSERELIDLLPRATWHRDAPVSEPADLPLLLLSRLARESVTVVLSGEGADELMGGYPRDIAEPWVAAYQRLVPPPLHRALAGPLAAALPYGARRLKILAGALGEAGFGPRARLWLGEPEAAALRPGATAALPEPRGDTALRRMLAFEQTVWLPDNLLERGDRMTMAHALEGRMPFLDREFADLAGRLPDEWRVRGFTGKRALRLAMAPLLPAEVLRRPKVGFRLPVHRWFRGGMRHYLTDHLDGPDSRLRALFPADVVRAPLDEHLRGRRNHEKLLWALLTLEVFLRTCRPTV